MTLHEESIDFKVNCSCVLREFMQAENESDKTNVNDPQTLDYLCLTPATRK